MASKVKIKHSVNGKDFTIYGEQTESGVYVWIANGPILGTYRNERFGENGLTSESLRKVLFGGAQ